MGGFWVRTSVKVELTKKEQRLIGRHSSPRWELDIVGYSGRENLLRVVESKRFLHSVASERVPSTAAIGRKQNGTSCLTSRSCDASSSTGSACNSRKPGPAGRFRWFFRSLIASRGRAPTPFPSPKSGLLHIDVEDEVLCFWWLSRGTVREPCPRELTDENSPLHTYQPTKKKTDRVPAKYFVAGTRMPAIG